MNFTSAMHIIALWVSALFVATVIAFNIPNMAWFGWGAAVCAIALIGYALYAKRFFKDKDSLALASMVPYYGWAVVVVWPIALVTLIGTSIAYLTQKNR